MIVAVFCIGLFTAACQPKDARPGLWLTGKRTEELIQDWSFTNGVEQIFIETRTGFGFRRSTTIWCAGLEGRLCIGSYGDDVKLWERNVARYPAARLRIEDQIYDVAGTPIANLELSQELDERYSAKYGVAEVFGDDPPPWRYYSVAVQGQYGDAETQ